MKSLVTFLLLFLLFLFYSGSGLILQLSLLALVCGLSFDLGILDGVRLIIVLD
jgi:hypothetical protein